MSGKAPRWSSIVGTARLGVLRQHRTERSSRATERRRSWLIAGTIAIAVLSVGVLSGVVGGLLAHHEPQGTRTTTRQDQWFVGAVGLGAAIIGGLLAGLFAIAAADRSTRDSFRYARELQQEQSAREARTAARSLDLRFSEQLGAISSAIGLSWEQRPESERLVSCVWLMATHNVWGQGCGVARPTQPFRRHVRPNSILWSPEEQRLLANALTSKEWSELALAVREWAEFVDERSTLRRGEGWEGNSPGVLEIRVHLAILALELGRRALSRTADMNDSS